MAELRSRLLPLLGVIAGLWAMLPRFMGPALATRDVVEVVDHVVPGAMVLVASVIVLMLARRNPPSGSGQLSVGLLVVLAGVWMTATHAPLVAQARRGEAPWDATLFHSAPGLAVLCLGLLWAGAYWSGPKSEVDEVDVGTRR